MKRIVDGVTYNTATSTLVAQSTWERPSGGRGSDIVYTGELYQTRGGAFFLHTTWTEEVWVERNDTWEQRDRDEVTPMSEERAQKWMLEGDVEVFTNPFGDPPEAEAEAEPGSTVYVRVPPALKQTIDRAADTAELSTNAWAMKCMERCLSDEGKRALTRAWDLATHLTTEHEQAGAQFGADTLFMALGEIQNHLAQAAKELWGTDDFTKIAVEGELLDPDRFRHYRD
jgi:hypothetical protein